MTGSESYQSSQLTQSIQHQTLVFLTNCDQVLLGLKKRGFAVNTWNGYGGKADLKETPIECAVRELEEESGLIVQSKDLQYVGTLKVKNRDVHLYTIDIKNKDIGGELKETDEMKPQWFQINQVPYEQMLPDARKWLPLLFQGRKFDVHIRSELENTKSVCIKFYN